MELHVNYVHLYEVRKTHAASYVKTIKTRTSFVTLERVAAPDAEHFLRTR